MASGTRAASGIPSPLQPTSCRLIEPGQWTEVGVDNSSPIRKKNHPPTRLLQEWGPNPQNGNGLDTAKGHLLEGANILICPIEVDTPLQSESMRRRRLLLDDVVNWITTEDPATRHLEDYSSDN